MTPLHFKTGNRVLAHALDTVGLKCIGGTNDYDDAALDRYGCKSVREAREAGKPGKVEYWFEPTRDLHDAIQAFDRQQDAIKKGEHTPLFDNTGREIDHTDAIRVACAVLKSAETFKNLWRKFPAFYLRYHEGETKRTKNADGSTTVTSPGFIRVGEKVSAEQAEALGL